MTESQIYPSLQMQPVQQGQTYLNPQPVPPQQMQVIIQQVQQPVHNDHFHNGICDCCAAGPYIWFKAFFCCCSKGILADSRTKFDRSNCCFNSCCFTAPALRNIVREGYGIHGNCMGDMCYSCCCAPCSAVQVAAEVEKRGPVRQQMN